MGKPLDRSDFPDCASCPYAQHGPWHVCVACAGETLRSIQHPCPICSQETGEGTCFNRLCTGSVSERHIERIEAIALHTDPLDRVIRRFKYEEKYGWALIFARLLIGHLNNRWQRDDVDLIIANPGHPGREHNRHVIRNAALQDFHKRWPFDAPDSPTLVKEDETTQSAGETFVGKRRAAAEHASALQQQHPARIAGKRIILYDDICTTGLQINAVAKRLRSDWGAISVVGVVLARHPWRY